MPFSGIDSSMMWELLPVPFSCFRLQHGVGAVTVVFSVPFSGIDSSMGAVACALFRVEGSAWCGSCCLCPFQGLGTSMVWELLPVPFSGIDFSMVWELLPVPFSGRGLVAGQEGLIQLCTGTGNSGA